MERFQIKQQQAFTLLETLITVAILAVVFAVAVPLLSDYVTGVSAQADDKQLVNALSQARNYARTNNRAVQIENDTANQRIRILETGTNPAIVAVYPLSYKSLTFRNSTTDTAISSIQVANTGTFIGQNEIEVSLGSDSQTFTLLRSGRLESQ